MITWQQPEIVSKCYGTASKIKLALQKHGESSILSNLSLDSSILCKTSYFSISQCSTPDEELFSWKWLPNRTNKHCKRAFSLFSKVACVMTISCPTSPIVKPKNSLINCLTDTQAESYPRPLCPLSSSQAGSCHALHKGSSRCL